MIKPAPARMIETGASFANVVHLVTPARDKLAKSLARVLVVVDDEDAHRPARCTLGDGFGQAHPAQRYVTVLGKPPIESAGDAVHATSLSRPTRLTAVDR